MHAGRADLKGIFRLGTKRDHIKFRMWQLNSLIRYTRILSKKRGKYCGQATLVIDLEGFEFSKLYMPTFKLFNEANKLAQMVGPMLHSVLPVRHMNTSKKEEYSSETSREE